MKLILKALRLVIVVGGYGALGYAIYKKVQPAQSPPASPYPSPGARATPPPADPVGPVDPELINGLPTDVLDTGNGAEAPAPAAVAADPAETDRIADEVGPDDAIDLSSPLAAGDVDRAD